MMSKYVVKKFVIIIKTETYYLGCKKHTHKIGSKEITMTNLVIRDKSRCFNCMSCKSIFLKRKQ